MKSLIISSLLSIFLISGCATNLTWKERLTGIGDTAVAVAQYPFCRAEWETYVTVDVKLTVIDEQLLLDDAFDKFITIIKERPSISVKDGFALLARANMTKVRLEYAFGTVVEVTKDYAKSISPDERNETLIACETQVIAGWKAVTDDSPLLDWVKTYGPYAKAGVELLPLLLMNDEPDDKLLVSLSPVAWDGDQDNGLAVQ